MSRLLSQKPLASIVSAGCSKFGKRTGIMARELFVEAFEEAIARCKDPDIRGKIKLGIFGNFSEFFEHQAHVAPILADWLGMHNLPSIRVENACASGSTALRTGIMAIQSGLYDIVLVGGVEKMNNRTTPEVTEALMTASDVSVEQWSGLTFVGVFALMATAHMHRYGTTEEQLAMVAVKNHKNAYYNPKAHMQKLITVEDALKSRVIAWPLKLYDCSLVTDGAACLILTKPEIAEKFTDLPIDIIGSGHSNDHSSIIEKEDITEIKGIRIAAREALEQANLTINDIDVFELHDCFTIAEIIEYEELGFTEKGKGGKLVEKGITDLNGEYPSNPSGGLKAKGHPVGATGIAQIYELYLQLRNEAGQRQVKGAKIGLAQNMGGSGLTHFVTIVKARS
ncbi:MAG: thiolase domain-containing protein [Thermoproteota archaeon]|jgi:acetyl-CoA C-acetyltransferase|nr:thiolase domain-containing protein [Thermoproteota archaeon]